MVCLGPEDAICSYDKQEQYGHVRNLKDKVKKGELGRGRKQIVYTPFPGSLSSTDPEMH